MILPHPAAPRRNASAARGAGVIVRGGVRGGVRGVGAGPSGDGIELPPGPFGPPTDDSGYDDWGHLCDRSQGYDVRYVQNHDGTWAHECRWISPQDPRCHYASADGDDRRCDAAAPPSFEDVGDNDSWWNMSLMPMPGSPGGSATPSTGASASIPGWSDVTSWVSGSGSSSGSPGAGAGTNPATTPSTSPFALSFSPRDYVFLAVGTVIAAGALWALHRGP